MNDTLTLDDIANIKLMLKLKFRRKVICKTLVIDNKTLDQIKNNDYKIIKD